MKKLLLGVVVLFALFVTGCSKAEDDVTSDTTNNTDYTLLEGYPEDVLPLYEMTSIDQMAFSYRDDYNYVVGKDIYKIYYTSSADIDEISEYYLGLLTSIEDQYEDWFDEYSFQGSIGDNGVIISMYENNGVVEVSMTVGLTEDEYVDENPFFEDAPTDLMVVSELTEVQEYTYRKYYNRDEIYYITIFESNFNEDTFKEYYEDLYKDKTDYNYEQTEYNDLISFKDDIYTVRITYDEAYGYNFVNIEVSCEE